MIIKIIEKFLYPAFKPSLIFVASHSCTLVKLSSKFTSSGGYKLYMHPYFKNW